jgi:hypothetical protein
VTEVSPLKNGEKTVKPPFKKGEKMVRDFVREFEQFSEIWNRSVG